jgi:hypothetical protein
MVHSKIEIAMMAMRKGGLKKVNSNMARKPGPEKFDRIH